MSGALRHGRSALVLISGICLAVVVGVMRPSAAAREAPRSRPPAASTAADQDPAPQPREWHLVARKYRYSVPRIEVQQDDLVKITLETADIPHSFTLDEPYRIAKRATPGHPVVFEFRADKPGTFEFYCNLKADDGCRTMKGQLVVTRKR